MWFIIRSMSALLILNIASWALAIPVEDNEMQWGRRRPQLPPAPSNATPKERSNYLYQRCMEDFFIQREEERQKALNEGREVEASLRKENDFQAAKETGSEHSCFLHAWFTTEVQPDPYPGLDSSGDGVVTTSPVEPQDDTHNEFRLPADLGSKIAGLAGRVGSVLNNGAVSNHKPLMGSSGIPNPGGLSLPLPARPLMVPRS